MQNRNAFRHLGATLPASIKTSAHLLCAPIQNTVDSESPDLWHLETLQALQIVMREIHRRQHGASTQTRLIIVVTEIAELLQRKGLQHLLDQVIQQGRGVRVHVVAGTSEVRPEVLQHTLLQHHFQARLVGQMPGNADSELACGGPDYHCEWSLGNGDFTYTQSSQRFQCGIVSDGELKYLPRALGLPDVWNLSSW